MYTKNYVFISEFLRTEKWFSLNSCQYQGLHMGLKWFTSSLNLWIEESRYLVFYDKDYNNIIFDYKLYYKVTISFENCLIRIHIYKIIFNASLYIYIIIIIIISNLSNDRSKASSKTIPPHSAI